MGMVEKVPCDVIERPKMPRATWDALRAHVVRERQKKKEENQEFERQKLAREHKKKEDAATLEDIKEQIRRTEDKLDSLKKEKHELFTTLKRVLNEQSKEKPAATTGQSTYLQPSVRPNQAGQFHRGGVGGGVGGSGYVTGASDPYGRHLLQAGSNSAKRPRSPSPTAAGGIGGRKAGSGGGVAAGTAAWPGLLPPAGSAGGGDGSAAVASHYAAAAAGHPVGAGVESQFARAVTSGDPKMMRLSTGGRASYVTSSSNLRGQPPISHPPPRPQMRGGPPLPGPPAHTLGTMATTASRPTIAAGQSAAFRTQTGSIVTGFPRYQNPTMVTTSFTTTSTPALSLTRQTISQQNPSISQNGGGPRYFPREN